MICKLYGALFVVAGCAGIGHILKTERRQEVAMLQQIQKLLDHMICDLQYQQYPLIQLVKNSEHLLAGTLRGVFERFAAELLSQIAPDASCCMAAAISTAANLPASVHQVLAALGQSFGRYDMEGQLRCLEAVQAICAKECAGREDKLVNYVRCCHAYSLGAGVILALILL